MQNWIECGVKCMDPLLESIKMLHPETRPIKERLDADTQN